jgi:DNA-binding CsgD family transcriptional regulator
VEKQVRVLWTDREMQILRKMKLANIHAILIAERLGRTRWAIGTKWKNMRRKEARRMTT